MHLGSVLFQTLIFEAAFDSIRLTRSLEKGLSIFKSPCSER